MVDGAVPRIIRFKRPRACEMLTAGDARGVVLKTGRSGGNAAVFGWVVGALRMLIVRVMSIS